MQVRVLEYSNRPLDHIYLSARQCYYPGWAGDIDISTIPHEEKANLVRKIVRQGHTSVLEHASIQFAVKGISRACSHQIVRSRIGVAISQQSQRYNDVMGVYDESGGGMIIPDSIQKSCPEAWELVHDAWVSAHEIMREKKVPKEDSRYLAPQAVSTCMVLTFNFRSLLHFLSLRMCGKAQWEIRKLAEMLSLHARDVCAEVFDCSGPPCKVRGFCTEDKPCGIKIVDS